MLSLRSSIDYRGIAQKAEAILHDANITNPPVPIKEIVENHGVDVIFVQFETLRDQVAGLTKFDEDRIYVNADDRFNRQIFTIAHEFGHWILHRERFLKDPEKYNVLLRKQQGGRNEDPLEKEANTFAANILVPKFLLKPIKNLAGTRELANLFMVSVETMENRLKHV